MFYMQCNECNERWELGTAITCKCSEKEPLEYSNAVVGWVKISELREHFDSVGCGTIYKTSGEGRVALCVAQPEQKPVATVTSESGNPDITMSWWHEPALPVGTMLYVTPPQRTWVGLANHDWNSTPYSTEFRAGAEWAEAKVKEKNNTTLAEQTGEESSILFSLNDGKEVMRIDKNGVTANPEIRVDEAGAHVISALDVHIKNLIKAERNACAKIAETPVFGEQDDITMEAKDRIANDIRAR